MSADEQRRVWNESSHVYQQRHHRETAVVQYGPLAPDEDALDLLGAVAGQTVLVVGCGGGQNCIALARRGATVTGVDVSDAQIAHAQRLATAADADVSFVRGNAADLSFLPDESQDWVLAIYVFPYVEMIEQALAECARVLRPGGRLLISQDHPIRACYWDEANGEESILPARSYFDPSPLRWSFAETGTRMTSHHRTVGRWISLLHRTGFCLRRLLEFPLPPGMDAEPWADEYTAEIAANLPQTILFLAEKQNAETQRNSDAEK